MSTIFQYARHSVLALAIVVFSHSVVASDSCDTNRLTALARIAVYSFSSCLTVYDIERLDRGEVNYDVEGCSQTAKESITKYLGPCGRTPDDTALANWPISDFLICKSIRIANRAAGSPVASSGDDREACAAYAFSALAKRSYDDMKRKKDGKSK